MTDGPFSAFISSAVSLSAVGKMASFKAAGKFVIKAYKGGDRESEGFYQVPNGDHHTVISQ